MCQRRYFNHTFDRRHYPNRTIACGLCFILQPIFFRNYSAGCSRHSVYVFFNPLLLRIDNKFKPSPSDRGSLFEGFLQNPYTFTYFCHHTAIWYFGNWLIIFYLGYFFYIKDYFAFRKIFSTCHIARGIIKLIAWITSFLEEPLDFEIT